VTLPQLAMVTGCVLILAVGQVLFKLSAGAMGDAAGFSALARLLTNGWIYVALAAYAVATVLWVWVLREVPLSRAYPLYALTFLLVPLLSGTLLAESVPLHYWVGVALIFAGICVTIR